MDFAEQALLYRRHLAEALKRPPKITLRANVLMHSLGYFSDRLSHDEKTYFLQNIDRYKNKKLPFSALLTMLQSWIIRFSEDYLRNQTFFEPFPEELIEPCGDTQCEWAGSELLKSEMLPEGL
ncbi:MAG: YbgA family protein [Methanotrichaceae archaeon]|nr:YbgA family protein [Methanotrichaceae archaeon]